MNSLLVKPPNILKMIYPKRIWSLPNIENKVFLTFDDGPIPEITPWVLDLLKEHNAKATFFCIGENIEQHIEIFKRIIKDGHSFGNHTFNHLNGWKTSNNEYIENAVCVDNILIENKIISEKKKLIFRPPYGRLTSKQSRSLQKMGYRIFMWDVLSGDFSRKTSPEKCLSNVINYIKPGSVIVFHDSVKAERNLRYVLPKVLEFIASQKWKCAGI